MAYIDVYVGKYHDYYQANYPLACNCGGYNTHTTAWTDPDDVSVFDWFSYDYGDEDNELHYADSVGESFENSSAEVLLTGCVIDGSCYEDIDYGGTVRITVEDNSGNIALKYEWDVRNPSDCADYTAWCSTAFYIWVGKGFEHSCTQNDPCIYESTYDCSQSDFMSADRLYYYEAELDRPGYYHITFEAPWVSTVTKTFKLDGHATPEFIIDSCYIKNLETDEIADEYETLNIRKGDTVRAHYQISETSMVDTTSEVRLYDTNGNLLDSATHSLSKGGEAISYFDINPSSDVSVYMEVYYTDIFTGNLVSWQSTVNYNIDVGTPVLRFYDANCYAVNLISGKQYNEDEIIPAETNDDIKLVYQVDEQNDYRSTCKVVLYDGINSEIIDSQTFDISPLGSHSGEFLIGDIKRGQSNLSSFTDLSYLSEGKAGQRIYNVPDLKIEEISFWIEKDGSPTGDVWFMGEMHNPDYTTTYFGDIWGDASEVSAGMSKHTLVLDTPVQLSSDSLLTLYVYYTGGDGFNRILLGKYSRWGSDILPNEIYWDDLNGEVDSTEAAYEIVFEGGVKRDMNLQMEVYWKDETDTWQLLDTVGCD